MDAFLEKKCLIETCSIGGAAVARLTVVVIIIIWRK